MQLAYILPWRTNMRCTRIMISVGLAALFLGCTEKAQIIEQKCSQCHSSSYVYKQKRTMEEWGRLLTGMKARGLKLTSEEEKTVTDILSKNYSLK
jgi:hypothetical protein